MNRFTLLNYLFKFSSVNGSFYGNLLAIIRKSECLGNFNVFLQSLNMLFRMIDKSRKKGHCLKIDAREREKKNQNKSNYFM